MATSVSNIVQKDTVSIVENTVTKIISEESVDDIVYNISDTVISLKFEELTVIINRMQVFDENNQLEKIHTDTVYLYPELGETIENQSIKIISSVLNEVKIEQRFETSLTVNNEGPHCDLTNWKHHLSEWNEITKEDNNNFVTLSYTESDWKKFPNISMHEVKEAVKNICDEEWYELIKNAENIGEYPIEIGISKIFLKVSGISTKTYLPITKIIVVIVPMGC